jgi:hypothetical protein
MSRTYKIILGALILVIGISIYMEATKPMPLNWTPNYAKSISIPLGAKAINLHFEEMKESNPAISEINKSTFEAFQQNEIDEGSILYFNNYLGLDKESLEKLFNWVKNGNTIFLSANSFPNRLKDTLGVKTDNFVFNAQFNYKNELSLANPNVDTKTYTTATEYDAIFFKEIDTLSHKVLGFIKPITKNEFQEEPEKLVNFIEVPFGKGKILLHTFPQAFGNHFFVHQNNNQYTQGILQYLDWNQPIYIDQHYKSGAETIDSLLYYVMQNKATKWAYYLSIIASIIFVFIQGKRKQKPIPIQTPLANKTYEYTKTVANMFLEERAHKEVATKQIKLLMNHIRIHYKIPTREINQSFYKELATKSAQDESEIKSLFKHIEYIEARKEISKEDVMKLDELASKIKH